MMSAMMLVLLLGGGNNTGDLLDFTPTGSYWEMRDQRVIDLDTMAAVLSDDDAKATDMLMAIRAIGEQAGVQEADAAAKAKALELLTPFLGSKKPFVDQYAKRSIAWVKGEQPQGYAPLPAEAYDMDLALLPENLSIVGQMTMANGVGPIDLATLIPDIKIEGQSIRDQMMAQMLPGLLEVVKLVGNARADLVTMGIVLEDEQNVLFMFVVRGQYDRVGVQLAMEEAAGDDEDTSFFSVGDIEVVTINSYDPVALMMPSDELFIFLFSENRGNKLPIDTVAKKLAEADRKPTFDETLSKQVAQIPRDKADVWAAMKVTPLMKQERELAQIVGAFDAGRAFAVRDAEGMLDIQWVGEGNDAAAVKNSTDFFTDSIKQAIDEFNQQKQQMPQEMRALMAPMVTMMQSMRFTAEGKNMTGGMKVDPSIGMTMPMMMFGMSVRREHQADLVLEAEDAAEEAVAE